MSEIYEKHGWGFLSGDMSYIEYGGSFYYKKPIMIGLDDDDEPIRKAYVVFSLYEYENNQTAVDLSLVCPEAPSEEERQRAINSCGWAGWDEQDTPEQQEIALVEILASYGLRAPLSLNMVQGYEMQELWDTEDLEDNEAHMWECVTKHAEVMGCMVGFALDRQCNAIGNSGWDFLAGNIGF